MTNRMGVKKALKLVLRKYRIAQETSNAEVATNAREFIRRYWSHRNTDLTFALPAGY